MINDIAAIIRSVGERTENLCHQALQKHFGEQYLVKVSESPFENALRKTCEIGLDLAQKYTIVFDADVLPEGSVVEKLLNEFERMPDNVFEIHGVVLDKFFYTFRPAGVHFYRTILLEKAYSLIPEAGKFGRPEGHILSSMQELGYPCKLLDIIEGIHDFEQSYFDIFRKAYQHIYKHNRYLPYFQLMWSRLAVKDFDYRVALHGIELFQNDQQMKLDSEHFENEYRDRFQQLGIMEKGQIEVDSIADNYVENTIAKYRPPLENRLYRRINEHYGESRPVEDFVWRLFGKINKMIY